MNKIVCDVCGTSYPDTAAQCPICGTAKTDANKSSTGGEAGYAYVKGGRFSKANVRKRNAGQKELPRVVAPVKPKKEAPAQKPATKAPAEKSVKKTPAEAVPARQKKEQQENSSSNAILIIIAILLVIAIIAVCAYIVKEYIVGDKPDNSTTQSTTTTAEQMPCTGLKLSVTSHTFTTSGETFMIAVTKTPANTTDAVRFESSDEQVATVNEKGVVTAVASGTATITIYCGDQMAQFAITCDIPVEPGPETQPSGPVDPADVLELNRTEFTLTGYGSSHNLYDGELDPATITWTSSDEAVATVTNGKVMAVGNGTAVITAEYMGQTVTCTVHCNEVVVSDYKLGPDYGFGADYSVSVGDTIQLYLTDRVSGLRIQAENLSFALSKEGVVTIDASGKVTAIASGTVTVTVTYGELTFKAIVRVYK